MILNKGARERAINYHQTKTGEERKIITIKRTMLARKRRMEIIRRRTASKNRLEEVPQIQQQLQQNHRCHILQGDISKSHKMICNDDDAAVGDDDDCKINMLQPQQKQYDDSLSMLLENSVLSLNSTRKNHSTCDDSFTRLLPSSEVSSVLSLSSSSSSSLSSSPVVVDAPKYNNTNIVSVPLEKVAATKKKTTKKKKYKRYIPTDSGAVKMSREELRQWRKEQRMVRNRESAGVSRMKTRKRITDLESEMVTLSTKYQSALKRIAELAGTVNQQQQQQKEVRPLDDSVSYSSHLPILNNRGEDNYGRGRNNNKGEERTTETKIIVEESMDNAMHITNTNFRSNAWTQRKISNKICNKILNTIILCNYF